MSMKLFDKVQPGTQATSSSEIVLVSESVPGGEFDTPLNIARSKPLDIRSRPRIGPGAPIPVQIALQKKDNTVMTLIIGGLIIFAIFSSGLLKKVSV